jgi:chromosome segregation ATPase
MRVLAEREFECTQLRERVAAAEKTEAELRAEISSTDERLRKATANLRAEKVQIEEQLTRAREEEARLQNEIASMKRDAEQRWTTERVENALLRERINDIAAEIARLTLALESPASPIEAMLAGEPAGATVYQGDAPETKGNLAERIRALQLKASRAPVAN